MVYMEFRNYRQEAYAASIAKSTGGSNKITIVSTLRDRTPVPQPEELDEAEVKWGKPSNFSWGSTARDFDEGIIPKTDWNNTNPDGPPDDEEPGDAYVEEWQEVDRKETTVRIDGPDGAYVDFARIDEVKFKLPDLPDGREHYVIQKFKAAGDEITPGPAGAGSGGSGASASGVVPVGPDGIIRDPLASV